MLTAANAYNLQHFVEAVLEVMLFFSNGDKQISTDSSPDLAANGVFRAAEEMPDP